MRFFKIYPNNHYSYSKEIREEIEKVFEITLSGEVLRPHFNKWKCKIGKIPLENQDKSNKNSHEHCECDNSVNESSTVLPVDLCFASQSDNRKLDVSESKVPLFIRHAGIVLFSQYLARIDEVFGSKGSILKQWLAIFFLESVNIEQSKYLDFHSLSLLLGKTIRQPFTQRQLLNDISNEDTFDRLFRLNGDLCDIENCSDFYYDPHTKQYTGTYKILKGWCGSIGHPDKILNSDFIHSSNGQPLYMVHSDNYYDLRERYNAVIFKFRKCLNIDSSKCITMIVDRGIYSEDVLNNIAKDTSQQIITWEKNFKADETLWKKNKIFHFCLKKYRNNSTDIRYYHFHYIDVAWHKNPGIRRLVVKATNPSGRTIELGILATDMKRNPEGIISLIFSRWIQENDFKYHNKHYGLNQIISYDTIDYTELAMFLNDKGVVSGTYKALTHDRQQEEKRLKNLLFKKHQQTLKKSRALKQLEKVEKEIETSINKFQNNIGNNDKIIKLKKKRRQLKAKLGKWDKSTIESSVLECNTALENVCKQLAETKKEDSKLKTLIDQEYTSLDTRKKKMMDILKIYARNVFYHCFEYFKYRI
ncbi:MAG: hypothetical protein KAS32_27245 [Candidatus Peribacteraceae bacterium]|nr:hypothetical protein [Candidatus Peribacteraceae bacterium]